MPSKTNSPAKDTLTTTAAIVDSEVKASTESTYDYHGGSAPPAATEKIVEPKIVEKEVKDAVVHESVTAVKREEIQPVVERERIQTEVQQVVQPVLDVVTEPTTVEKVELEEQSHRYKEKAKEADIEKYEEQAEAFKDEKSTEVIHEKVYKAPIINETVKTKVITEIQPVIERVVHQTHVIEETQNIHETFVKAPIVHDQQVAAPITMSEFKASSAGTTPSKKRKSSRASLSPAPSSEAAGEDGPMTRLKRKKLAEAAEGTHEVTATHVEEFSEDASVEVSAPKVIVEPSKVHGALEKIVGTVQVGVGELLGSDRMVLDGEARKSEGEAEIRAASETIEA